jgi:hypothetical protein
MGRSLIHRTSIFKYQGYYTTFINGERYTCIMQVEAATMLSFFSERMWFEIPSKGIFVH